MWLISLDGTVNRWHLGGEGDPTPMRLPTGFRALAISESGKIHAGTDANGFAAVWDTRSDQVKKSSWKIADDDLRYSDFSEDGSTLVWMNKETAYVWNHQKDLQINPDVGNDNLPQHAQHLHLPSLSSDGTLLLTTGTQRRHGSDLWDVSSSNPTRAWPFYSVGNGPDSDATFSPDGTQVAISDWGRSIRLVDVKSGKMQHHMKGHTKAVYTMAYSHDGSRLASIGRDNKLCIWDVKTGHLLGKFPARQGFDWELEWSPMNDSIAVVKIG